MKDLTGRMIKIQRIHEATVAYKDKDEKGNESYTVYKDGKYAEVLLTQAEVEKAYGKDVEYIDGLVDSSMKQESKQGGGTMGMQELLKETTAAGMKIIEDESAAAVKQGEKAGKESEKAGDKVEAAKAKEQAKGAKEQDAVSKDAQKESKEPVKEESGVDDQSKGTISNQDKIGSASASAGKSAEAGAASDQSKTANAADAKNKEAVKGAITADGGEVKVDAPDLSKTKEL